MMCRARRQRGIAFVIVLWVIALVTVLMGSFAVIARTENLQARHLLDSTRARYASEAGINMAVYALSRQDPLNRWVGDGRPYRMNFGDAKVEVRLTDDSGKIDLNVAPVENLKQMFLSIGQDEPHAEALADAIVDWRDPDDNVSTNGAEAPEYKHAGLAYGPRNEPFTTVSELQQVLGMDYALFSKLQPAVTIYSGRANFNPAYAPLETLRTMPGMTDDMAQQIIALRQQVPPGTPAGQAGVTLPDGTPIVASGGGLTYSIDSKATLPNGASATLEATIRLGGVNASARPFVILRWDEGDHS